MPNREEANPAGLGRYLSGSVLIHVGLAFLLACLLVPAALPGPGVADIKQPEEKPQAKLPPTPEPEKEPARTEDDAKLDKLIREEVAREQLRPLFDKLTRGQFVPSDTEILWDELLTDLTPEFDELGQLLLHSEFDQQRYNELSQKLREQLLKKLEERLRAREAMAREQNLVQKADAIARALTENLRKALDEQVGRPVGDALNQTVQTDRAEGQKTLTKAAQDLATAAKTARLAEAGLQASRQNLDQATRDLETAQAKNDVKSQTQTQARVKAEQGKLAQAQLKLEGSKTQAQSAAQKLKDRHPEIAGPVAAVAKELETTSKEPVQRAANEAAQGKAATAARETKQAQEKTASAAASLEKLAQATQIQAAREQIAQARREAESKQVDRAETLAKTAVPSLEQSKQEAAAREVKAAGEKLAEAKQALLAKDAEKARPALEDALAKLQAIDAPLRREQEKLGVTPRDASEAVLARVDQVRLTELAKLVEQKLQPLLEEKLQQGLEKQPAARAEVSRRMAEELKKLDPGQVVAKSAGERLPLVRDPESKESASAHATAQGQKAREAAQTLLEKLLAPALDSSVKNALAQAGPVGASDLLRRLAALKGNGTSPASGLLDQPDGEAGAGLQARIKAVRDSKGWGRGLFEDASAYQRMKEFIQDRERLVGDIVGRQAGEGAVSQAQGDSLLRPAFVGLSRPTSEEQATATERKVPDPTFKTHRFAGIPLLPDDAITLDGDLADWKDLPALILLPVLKGNEAKVKSRPARQTAQVAWCRKGLLLAFDVEDTSGAIEPVTSVSNFWMFDCVEIFLDTLNTKSPNRGEPHTHQFFVFPFGPKDGKDVQGHEAFIRGDSAHIVGHPTSAIQKAARQTARGWTLEVLLSHDLLRQADLAPGRIVGFNLQIDTGSDLYYHWTASEKFRTSMHPNTWGDLQLLGSDARLAFLDAAGKKTREGVVPGQPLRVQVTDPDMNLSRQKKDRVGLSLRTAAGETRTLVLEETGPDTGIFEGAIATTLNVGGGSATTLPVFEGETLTAEYLDQVRAYGERNQKVTAKRPVNALGTRFER